ncbi:HD domain-containing phosphohydrolase, partial [Acinetobacter baumannii]
EEIAGAVLQSPNGTLSVLRLKLADEYTYLHSVAVCALMVALGRTLGLDEKACREAGLGGFLHDVGKAFLPHELLNKPGKLTDEEFTQ